jgi:chaperone BCS1
MWQYLTDQLAKNQFLSGGALIAVMGVLFAYLRTTPVYLYGWAKRRIITEIDIPDRDESFKWVNIWLSQHPYRKRCRLWTVQTKRKRDLDEQDKGRKAQIILAPAPGIHFMFYKRRLLILRRERKDAAEKSGISLGAGFRETFNITLFSRNKQIVLELIEEARHAAYPDSDARIAIMRPSEYNGEWCEISKRAPRPLASVILPDGVVETLVEDLVKFQASEDWYVTRGIPYRRGYLLYGEPGNGKSSLITALATKMQYEICALNLNSQGMNDERLIELMSTTPPQSFLLVEDIDCVFHDRMKTDEKHSVTFSGLLNAIDGVMASEGRILFMTTNHREALDPALIRPGRIDIKIELTNAVPSQMEKLFLRFFPVLPDMAKLFATKPGGPYSMATLQGHLLRHREDPVAAITQEIEREN